MNPIFTVNIVKGRLQDNRIEDYIKTLSDGEYEFIIRKPRKERSLNQNNYLWGVVYKLISDELGYSVDDVHEICKMMFLSHTVLVKGKEIKICGSTASLSTVEMESYLSSVRQWASAEISCFVPLPNEVDYQ